MPAGTDIIAWNPRVGDVGDDRYTWPPDRPLYAGTPASSFVDPYNPQIAEINAAEGLNQIIAEIRRRLPNAIDEQISPTKNLAIVPTPFFEDTVQPIAVDSIAQWWDPSLGVDTDPHVLAGDHYYTDGRPSLYRWAFLDDGTLDKKPTPPGNGFALTLQDLHCFLDETYTGSLPVPPTAYANGIWTSEIVTFIRKRLASEKIAKWPICRHQDRDQIPNLFNDNLELISSSKRIGDAYPPGGPGWYLGRYDVNDPVQGSLYWPVGQLRVGVAPYSPHVYADVRAISVSNISPLSGAPKIIDGVSVGSGFSVLLIGQADPAENGVYNTSTADWTRTKSNIYGWTFNAAVGSVFGGNGVYITSAYSGMPIANPVSYAFLGGGATYMTYRMFLSVRVPDEPITSGLFKFMYATWNSNNQATRLVLCDLGSYVDISAMDWARPRDFGSPPWGTGAVLGSYPI